MPTLRALALLLLATPALAQSPQPAFPLADVHPSPKRLRPSPQFTTRANGYQLRDATMIDLISAAYRVEPVNISGGPPWIDFDRFDIYAKVPPNTPDDTALLMLRSLLADRFHLVAHPGTKPLPAYVLTAGKSPKLKPAADPTAPSGCDPQPPPKGVAIAHFLCHNITMQSFEQFLSQASGLPHPVVDSTNLTAAFDLDIQWPDSNSVPAALSNQLGLKLEPKTAPLPVLVVASVDEKPTPNISDLAKLLPPPPPAAFDVAVIRPSNPDEKNFDYNTNGSAVTIKFATLQTLVSFAYDTVTGKIANKPPFLNDQHWDILGKVTPSANTIFGRPPDLDDDDIKEMLRSLLADRFKMTSHPDTRLADAYVLVAANPKLKPADPANHTNCSHDPAPGAKDPRMDNPILSQLLTCQNMTMAQFVEELQSFASGYLPSQLIDSTGLTGAYDFTLNFSRKRDVRNAAPSAASDDGAEAPTASDPSGAISLFDAVQKQLGLKLEKKSQLPTPILVIDHIEPQPTDN